MTMEKLMENMLEYNRDCVGYEFPMNTSCFYSDIWNDWKNDNKITIVDALALWDYIMKTDWIYNDIEDYDLEYKEICEKIRLMKKDCDF